MQCLPFQGKGGAGKREATEGALEGAERSESEGAKRSNALRKCWQRPKPEAQHIAIYSSARAEFRKLQPPPPAQQTTEVGPGREATWLLLPLSSRPFGREAPFRSDAGEPLAVCTSCQA